jgi:hypothetical protein
MPSQKDKRPYLNTVATPLIRPPLLQWKSGFIGGFSWGGHFSSIFTISLHKKFSQIIRWVAFCERGLIRGVAFGESGLIRGVAFGESGLIRGVAFGESGLIREGLL